MSIAVSTNSLYIAAHPDDLVGLTAAARGTWLPWEAIKPRAVRKGEARSPARRIAESNTQPLPARR